VAYETQHKLSTPKARFTPAIITRKGDMLVDSEKVCAKWADAERRIHNVG